MQDTSKLPPQITQNPLFKRAQQMADGKTQAECEQIAKNLCQQRGVDFDGAWDQFKKIVGV